MPIVRHAYQNHVYRDSHKRNMNYAFKMMPSIETSQQSTTILIHKLVLQIEFFPVRCTNVKIRRTHRLIRIATTIPLLCEISIEFCWISIQNCQRTNIWHNSQVVALIRVGLIANQSIEKQSFWSFSPKQRNLYRKWEMIFMSNNVNHREI